jgi:uncharacterized protein (DUF934 family)
MPFIRAGRLAEDRFVRVRDEEPVPEGVPVLLPAARFLADHADLSRRDAPVGVIWPNDRRIAELAPHLDQVALVALVFPTFRDGRAYSQARILRERHGFRGELRATGDVLRDQFLFLVRAGFDAFEVKKDSDAGAFAAAFARFSVVYQPAADKRAWAFKRRLAERAQREAETHAETVS